MPLCRAIWSRSSYIALNFQVVSTCSSGNGGAEGWNALRAKCSITALSLPTEYSITGFSDSATTSRMMWIDSASSRWRCVSVDEDRSVFAGVSISGRDLSGNPGFYLVVDALPAVSMRAGVRASRLDRMAEANPTTATRGRLPSVRPQATGA